jgi:hydrogenase expression/formation protein HypE
MKKSPSPERILLAHGSGGTDSHRLITEELLSRFGNPILDALEDQGSFYLDENRLALTTDSYVVSPLFFPGGNIGDLAVNGTINDLVVGGCEPLYLTLALIIEEGFPMSDLGRILDSAAEAAKTAGVTVIAGDTKVVDRGSADGLFINTSGIGRTADPRRVKLSAAAIRPGDRVLLSGTIGDHGMAVLTCREGLKFETPIMSDTAPLHELIGIILRRPESVRAMRDPTRGGLASSLVEMAGASGVTIEIREECLPMREEVRGACEILGLDPIYVANEGKVLAFLSPDAADGILEEVRRHPQGREAELIGEVTESSRGKVIMSTAIGGRRIVTMLTGDQLPRIC